MDKQIIYNCPHISLTDWGTYACKLYNPRDKNCIVSGGNCASNTNCLYKLKAENEELKTGLKQIQEQFGIEILYCKTTGESTFRSTDILKLKKALNEIKEIAENVIKNVSDSCIETTPMYYIHKQILQKISECEVEDGSN